MSQISQNIRYLRRLHDYTQEQFSEKLGIKRSALGAYEEARAIPNLPTLMQIAQMFAITMEELISADVATLSLFAERGVLAGEDDFAYENPADTFEEELRVKFKPVSALEVEEKAEPTIVAPTKDIEPSKQPSKAVKSASTSTPYYPTLEEGLFSVDAAASDLQANNNSDIAFVNQSKLLDYLANYNEKKFVEQLPKLQISLLSKNQEYRAFEMGTNFIIEKSICVGSYFKNWYNTHPSDTYLLLTQKQGLLYGTVENKLKTAGFVEVKSSEQVHRVYQREIFEIWQFQLLISAGRV